MSALLTLSESIATHARLRPAKVGARDSRRTLTYAEWDARASRLAPSGPAALFAGVHYGQWPAPIPLFVLAVGLGLLYRRTGGIVAPIAMHATFNGLSTAAMIAILLLVPQPIPGPGE